MVPRCLRTVDRGQKGNQKSPGPSMFLLLLHWEGCGSRITGRLTYTVSAVIRGYIPLVQHLDLLSEED